MCIRVYCYGNEANLDESLAMSGEELAKIEGSRIEMWSQKRFNRVQTYSDKVNLVMMEAGRSVTLCLSQPQ